MQINKINSKLIFDVEAQLKCPHGKKTKNNACTTDCVKVSWHNSSASNVYRDAYSAIKSRCYASKTYSCSLSHCW